MGEERKKRVEVCTVSLDFGSLTRMWLVAGCMYPGFVGKGWNNERAEEAISENLQLKTKRTLTYLRCDGNRPCASASS